MENNEIKITIDGVTKTYRVILNLEDIDGILLFIQMMKKMKMELSVMLVNMY